MKTDSCIFVAGHRGLVGSALVRVLRARGFTNIVTKAHDEIDLTNPLQVEWLFSTHKIEYVFLCAAKVGGIKANAENPVDFFSVNIAIEANVMHIAAKYGVKKLVFLGSSCIYPRDCPQPIKEEYLLTGPLEKTNEAYALAKICGVKLCQWLRETRGCDFVSAMPCNLFGPGDNFNEHTAHIVPGMMARMHRAKVENQQRFDVWGDGTAKREILFSDDLADALILVMDRYESSAPINTGSSREMSVRMLAEAISCVIGYTGRIECDPRQPVGTPRKLLDNQKLEGMGWFPKTSFHDALQITYESFLLTSRR